MHPLEVLNRSVFLHINAGAATPLWAIDGATAVADGLIYAIPLMLLWLWLRGDSAQRHVALKACAVTFLALGMNQVIGLLWQHPRPFMVGLGHSWIAHAADSSFPSDHMTVFVGIGLTLWLAGVTRWGALTLAGSFCIAWARVFLGVHFPLDMVGAAAVAGIAHLVVAPLWRLWGHAIGNWAERVYERLFASAIRAGWAKP